MMMEKINLCMRKVRLFILLSMVFLSACEDTNLWLALEAGIDAVRALSISDEEVEQIARIAADRADEDHRIAPPGNPYAKRLNRLVEPHLQADGYRFNYGVYLAPEVNAFAMADGTIRVYSGLMDLLNDAELLFVIGHEMGHVVEAHIRRKMVLAMAGSALRKGIASQENAIGDLARSELGSLVELLLNAQFSQKEERSADDYGLAFMHRMKYPPEAAVSALQKLAGLQKGHSFLSSHPAPDDRAERIAARIQSPGQPSQKGVLDELRDILSAGLVWMATLFERLADLASGA